MKLYNIKFIYLKSFVEQESNCRLENSSVAVLGKSLGVIYDTYTYSIL